MRLCDFFLESEMWLFFYFYFLGMLNTDPNYYSDAISFDTFHVYLDKINIFSLQIETSVVVSLYEKQTIIF